MTSDRASLTRLIAVAASPKVPFFLLPYLMILLAAGTLAQKEMGLYAATQMFFSSWVVWLGPLPLPGLYPAVALLSFSLFLKFVFKSVWSWARAGTIVTHAGVLVLLCGGLLTALTQKEGFMTIAEGENSALVQDYHSRVLTVTRDGKPVIALPHTQLRSGDEISSPDLPFRVNILQYALNNEPAPQEKAETPGGLPWRGPAAQVMMKPRPADPQDENNHAALNLIVTGAGEDHDGGYLLTELMPHRPEIIHKGYRYVFSFARAETTLPFSLALRDITRELHPGTTTARAYRADLILTDGAASWPVTIGMNEPLRYRGYTFYQSSYIRTEGGEATVLSVVRNSGRLFPYAASALIAAGLLLHLVLRIRGRAFAAALVLCVLAGPVQAQKDALTWAPFSTLAIQDHGRLKPLGSFATATLRHLSGDDGFGGKPAAAWLAQTLFDPAMAAENRVLLISSEPLRALLDLPAREDDLYTLGEVGPALARAQETLAALAGRPVDRLNETEAGLVALRDKAELYLQLLRSFSLVLPLAVEVPAPWQPADGKPITYLSLEKHREEIEKELQRLIRRKGEDISRYNEKERALATLGWQMQALRAGGADNTILRIIPPQWHNESAGEEWLAPWDLLLQGRGGPGSAALLADWANLAAAWAKEDDNAWKKHLAAIREKESLTGAESFRLRLESLYNHAHPTELTFGLYVFLFITALLFERVPTRQRGAAFIVLSAVAVSALLVHGGLLAARVAILARPPVGTLYESILFVSFLCAGIALAGGVSRKNTALLALGAFTGAGLLLLSAYFARMQGDTMVMLMAVLNTNFWLATHVLFITAGYAFAVLAACLAHLQLFRAARGMPPALNGIQQTALAALFFAATGTILGGIWADQSWGRFWGWDPKENGALMIVLWLAWYLHGRLAGTLDAFSGLVVMALLNVIVALSWFGVNLLNVGLHSYGFTSGIAVGLFTFCATEATLIAFMWSEARRHARLS